MSLLKLNVNDLALPTRARLLAMWCTPTTGLLVAAASVLAEFEQTFKHPAIPAKSPESMKSL